MIGEFDAPEESLVAPFQTWHGKVVKWLRSFRDHSHDDDDDDDVPRTLSGRHCI